MSSQHDVFWNALYKEAETRKPVAEIQQYILRLKLTCLLSSNFKSVRDQPSNVSESFLNQMMQLSYNVGASDIEDRSYNKGYEQAMKDVAKKLGFDYET